MTPFVEPAGVFVREAITNAYYDARNAGRTMEDAADDARDAVLAALGIPADATTDDIKAANLAGIAGRSPVDVRAGLILLDRLRNSSYRQDVDKATFAIQQAQRDYAAAVAEVEEAAR